MDLLWLILNRLKLVNTPNQKFLIVILRYLFLNEDYEKYFFIYFYGGKATHPLSSTYYYWFLFSFWSILLTGNLLRKIRIPFASYALNLQNKSYMSEYFNEICLMHYDSILQLEINFLVVQQT